MKKSAFMRRGIAVAFASIAATTSAFAQTPPKIDAGDTAWMIVATAFVLMMTIPGLALFYTGMVRKKNVLNTMAMSFVSVALVTLLWAIGGYSLAFTGDGAWIGSLDRIFLRGIEMETISPLAKTIPESLFMLYQGTFAIITVALVSGAVVDRMRFSAYLMFSVLWFFITYVPQAHWVWGGGFLQQMGVIDFAGGTVVHINAGVAALVAAYVIGVRRGYGQDNMAPYDLSMAVIGTGLLWVGWFGFNGGSALGAGGRATMAIVVTHLAACTGAAVWMALEWYQRGKPSVLGMISGAIAGLGTITPASGFVLPWHGVVIGALAGVICYYACTWLKHRLRYDDSLDVFGVHGVGGIIGTIFAGVFATAALSVTPEAAGTAGLIEGNPHQVWLQLIGVAATIAWSAVTTLIILKIVALIVPLRVSDEEERAGLDLRQHGEQIHT
ncbi:ammonia channel precursor [Variibacter gotjawalensis]|uniref:Ammonium transporter n=1 Tax=Variibacter gotjawalensis TaxID=1333996 RepID=A0A0S3PQG9_9BRAD|nr:ammonium transporter [Variibacter gotjawalensis]NIK48498.1 Amt family ammonium transporter [Variibacter gotjawalensis]RZS50365.1 ammonium transporter [Variibacter gotjawalensis]BAT58198.1 ammonia channel precursor [Variibacter gotjawalensis]